MIVSANATINYLNLPASTPVTVCIDARFIGGKMQLVRALTHNLPLQIFSPGSAIGDKLSQLNSLGLLSLVPLQLYSLLDRHPLLLNQATAILIGGAPLESSYLPRIKSIAPPVYHTYGMTETLSHIALKRLNTERTIDEFTTLPGISISIDKRDCLIVSGEVTGQDKIVTNDVVELTSPNTFIWKGRFDNVVNSGGVKLFPEEIDHMLENPMNALVPNAQFFSYGIADAKLGQKLILCIEGRESGEPAKILDMLKQVLPPFHSPREIYFLPKFFETPSGKLDKRTTVDAVLS